MFDDVELVLGAALDRMGCRACALAFPDAFCVEALALFALMAVRLLERGDHPK
jgi:hypothetical protein